MDDKIHTFCLPQTHCAGVLLPPPCYYIPQIHSAAPHSTTKTVSFNHFIIPLKINIEFILLARAAAADGVWMDSIPQLALATIQPLKLNHETAVLYITIRKVTHNPRNICCPWEGSHGTTSDDDSTFVRGDWGTVLYRPSDDDDVGRRHFIERFSCTQHREIYCTDFIPRNPIRIANSLPPTLRLSNRAHDGTAFLHFSPGFTAF